MDFDYEIMGVTEKIIHPQYDKTVVENDRKFSWNTFSFYVNTKNN